MAKPDDNVGYRGYFRYVADQYGTPYTCLYKGDMSIVEAAQHCVREEVNRNVTCYKLTWWKREDETDLEGL